MDKRINLLPWRDEVNKLRNRIFYTFLVGTILVCGGILLLFHSYLQLRIEKEKTNVAYLSREERLMRAQIKEIQNLKEDKNLFLKEMRIIQSLQNYRTSIVILLDKLAYLIPEGVHLTQLTRKEKKGSNEEDSPYLVTVQGRAQTNASISLFLKRLEEELSFMNIKLNEVAFSKKTSVLTFKLEFNHGLLQEEIKEEIKDEIKEG